MDNGAATIWVKLGGKGGRPMHIGGIFCDHRLLLQDQPNMTGTPHLHKLRWNRIVKGWKLAAKNAKCITIGDSNLDYKRWDNPDPRVASMVTQTKNEIKTLGFFQAIKETTRSWPGQPDSLVDQLRSNSPESIISSSNTPRGPSDHNVIGAVLRTKDREFQEHDMWRRMREGMDVESFRNRVASIDWSEFYKCRNIDLLNSYLEDKIGEILDSEAPLKEIQARKKHRNWLSQEMKAEMVHRDNLKEVARVTGSPAAWNLYKKARNTCSKNLLKTKDKYYKEMYEKFEKENDTKNIYRMTRNILNWKTGGMPCTFLVVGRRHRKPHELANVQQEYFIEKMNSMQMIQHISSQAKLDTTIN